MKKNRLSDLLLFVVGAELIGVLSSVASGGRFGEFYGTLVKPPLSPPGWLFPIVWAVLYALMGVSAYLVYIRNDARKALRVYYAQLAVNFLWSPVFFGLRKIWLAAVVITVLIVLVVIMIVRFGKIRRAAAVLNIPYLIWLIYAAYLNFGTAVLNPLSHR
jgi:tryptophan-rich sensory protein